MRIQSPRGYPSLCVTCFLRPHSNQIPRGNEVGRGLLDSRDPLRIMAQQTILQNRGIVEPAGPRGSAAPRVHVASRRRQIRGDEAVPRGRGQKTEGKSVRTNGARNRENDGRFVEIPVEPLVPRGKRRKLAGKEGKKGGEVERPLVEILPIEDVPRGKALLGLTGKQRKWLPREARDTDRRSWGRWCDSSRRSCR